MQFIAIIKAALALLPVIIEAIKALEAAMPESGAGSAKLGVIRATLDAGYEKAADTVGTFDQIWPVLEKMIAAVVAAYNVAGIFKKK